MQASKRNVSRARNKGPAKRNAAACHPRLCRRDKEQRNTRSSDCRGGMLTRGRWSRGRTAARPLGQVLVNRLARGDPAAGGLAPGDTPGANQGLGAGDTTLQALRQFRDGDLLGWSCFFHKISLPRIRKNISKRNKIGRPILVPTDTSIIFWMHPMSNGPYDPLDASQCMHKIE